jgi:hypothetical protein
MGLRINDVEQNILYLQQNIQGQINLINQELARTVKKATPMPGYNPYNLGGPSLSAQVWMYDITPVDDSDIRWYYVQFNYINGNQGGTTDWMPLPKVFSRYVYALHPDFHVVSVGAPTLPVIYSAASRSYKVEIQDTELNLRLFNYASFSPNIVNDIVGILIIGNAPSSSEKKVEEMSTEELVKLAKELQVKVKGYEQTKDKQDKSKAKQEVLEQMKRLTDYEFIDIKPPKQPMTQSVKTK